MATSSASEHFVYLYRNEVGRPVYVGYGHDPQRALAHSGTSHNVGLGTFVEAGKFDLTIAGPYRDMREGKNVESALISALSPDLNKSPGEGKRFRPVGVPAGLADRLTLPPLTMEEIGSLTGGALLVYLAPGNMLSDGRKKFDMVEPDDADALSNMRGNWALTSHLDEWSGDPANGPQVLLGIHGSNPKHRFIVGAARIDVRRWGHPDLLVTKGKLWLVPLEVPEVLDAFSLRGRRVLDAKFGNRKQLGHMWIDGDGVKRHPKP